jgi:hypothetical protein
MNESPLDTFFDAMREVASADPENGLAIAVCLGIYLAEIDPALARYVTENTVIGPADARDSMSQVLDQLATTLHTLVRQERRGDLD